METTLYLPWTEDASRQYIDSAAVFKHYRRIKAESSAVRGSMTWKNVSGRDYLVRLNPGGAQHGLGARSEETEAMHASFMKRKAEHKEQLAAITQQLEQVQRLNKALRVGRTPAIVVDVLNAIEDDGLEEFFITVGTHSLYAYETAAAVHAVSAATATRDIDLLYDTRKHLKLVDFMGKRHKSLIGTLRKADKTFRVAKDQLQTAVNAKGFEVDVIRRDARDGDPHPLRMSDDEEDLWAVQTSLGHQMVSARRFEQVIVGTTGKMALMRTLHPLDFIAMKERLGAMPTRDPAKAPKDKLQAQLVRQLWEETLQHQPISEIPPS